MQNKTLILVFKKKFKFSQLFQKTIFTYFRISYMYTVCFDQFHPYFFLDDAFHIGASSPSQLRVLIEALCGLHALDSYFKELTNNYKGLTSSLWERSRQESQERDLQYNSLVLKGDSFFHLLMPSSDCMKQSCFTDLFYPDTTNLNVNLIQNRNIYNSV